VSQDDSIVVRGAREHNLKNITVSIPRGKLVVVTGLSGSGKSSLAFDTLFAEGRRRYVESLSAYARQFLGRMHKPDVDHIDGLSPAISIEQKTTHTNPRSTVGTVTEIYDYLRLLYARVGVPHCYVCGRVIEAQTPQQIVDTIVGYGQGTRVQVMAPVVRDRKGSFESLLEDIRSQGYVRVRIDGAVHDLAEVETLARTHRHNIDVIVDRIIIKDGVERRLTDSVETALALAGGVLRTVAQPPGADEPVEALHSEHFACADCGVSIPEITPRTFSFNSPQGACPDCTGLGITTAIDPELLVPDHSLSLEEGAVKLWSVEAHDSIRHTVARQLADRYGFSTTEPWKKISKKNQRVVLYGTGDEEIEFVHEGSRMSHKFKRPFEGVIPQLDRRFHETTSTMMRGAIGEYMSERACEACGGARLRPESRAMTVGGVHIDDIVNQSVKNSYDFFRKLKLPKRDRKVADRVLREIKERLQFLLNVGIGYLSLDRRASTLAGGEAQRIRLATQIGSGLAGVLYILDEPSIGIHQRDNERLLGTLTRLRDLGNTVVVVEHDEQTIREADHVIDLGPGAGERGGYIVAQGSPEDVAAAEESITGQYLSGKLRIEVPDSRRRPDGRTLTLHGARHHNLKNIDASFPVGLFTCVTGVSGSGKSSLVNETLYPLLARELHRSRAHPGPYRRIDGISHFDKVVDIDQSPIGRTPRSNPATYTGVLTLIRDLFARTPESRVRGYKPGRFSFNVKGGRCEACHGDGLIKIEMHFLPDVYVECEECRGKRFNRDTLEVRYRGKTIAEVLDMTVASALMFFANIPKLKRILQTIADVGLGYVRLGQPSTTLSGGEAQRVKLSSELARVSTGMTMYILDEPTTGLHAADIKKLLAVLHRLTNAGNTVIVIEHNLDVIKTADHIIDLGPEGGDEGGQIIAQGTPEQIARIKKSHTGRYLKQILAQTHKQARKKG
jgi:excinuclease ABC subunit A